AVHPLAEVRHQVAERSGLPALVQRLEALGDAVGGRGDLIRVDRVELLRELRPGQALGIPEDQRASADETCLLRGAVVAFARRQGLNGHPRLQPGRLDRVHTTNNASRFGRARSPRTGAPAARDTGEIWHRSTTAG